MWPSVTVVHLGSTATDCIELFGGGMTILRVKDWNERFESAKSRTYKIKSQTYMPNKQGLGYTRIMNHAQGPAIYGAWCALINLLSRQEAPRHGYLTDTGRVHGYPWTPDDISIQTMVPEPIIRIMIEFCLSQAVGWLIVTDATDTTVSLPRIPQGYPPLPLPSPLPLQKTPIVPTGDVYTEGFERFWKAYPKKIGKGKAFNAFQRAKNKPDLEQLLEILSRQSSSAQWTKDGGQYIPNPATWINERRWDDEGVTKKNNSSAPMTEAMRERLLSDA